MDATRQHSARHECCHDRFLGVCGQMCIRLHCNMRARAAVYCAGNASLSATGFIRARRIAAFNSPPNTKIDAVR
jgi:hypothetical protein